MMIHLTSVYSGAESSLGQQRLGLTHVFPDIYGYGTLLLLGGSAETMAIHKTHVNKRSRTGKTRINEQRTNPIIF
jgi:hypothetical protein